MLPNLIVLSTNRDGKNKIPESNSVEYFLPDLNDDASRAEVFLHRRIHLLPELPSLSFGSIFATERKTLPGPPPKSLSTL